MNTIGPGSDTADTEFPGQHFQGDLLLLALGSSQRDIFEDDWLDLMVRVYWLKARFLALQVRFLFYRLFLILCHVKFELTSDGLLLCVLPCLFSGGHGAGLGEL